MSALARSAPPSHWNPPSGIRNLLLTGGFWLFSYVMLAFRGALLLDWAPVVDEPRIIAVTLGALLYWKVLRRIDELGDIRSSLSRVVTWTLTGTLIICLVRVGLDQLVFSEPPPIGRSVSFTLSWSAYFGLWILGAVAFQPREAAARSGAVGIATRTVAAPAVHARPAAITDEAAWNDAIDCLIDEMADLRPGDRAVLAQRLVRRAGYELADGGIDADRHNLRVRLAERIAARVARDR